MGICKRCGIEFAENPKSTVEQKYCSHRCCIRANVKKYLDRKRALKVNIPRPVFSLVCEICKKEFSSFYENQRTCSIGCRKTKDNRRSQAGRTKSYVSKVPCEFCGFSDLRAINRHHLDIQNGNSGGVICLCANCHTIYHSMVGRKQVKATREEVLQCLKNQQKVP